MHNNSYALYSEIDLILKTSLYYAASELTDEPEVDAHILTRTPSPVTSTSDGSSDIESELLLSLPEQPELPMEAQYDRGGRPFPYTRSKTRWRKRPCDEIKFLQGQMVELEKVVSTLRSSSSRPEPENYTQESQKSRRKLKAALQENRKLRAQVAGQFQVAYALRTAIDEHLRLKARKVSWPNSAAAPDELIFALLDEEKERQYADFDKVLASSGIARVNHPLNTQQEFQRNSTGVSFQHNEVRMLPFAVADVARALRYCLSHGLTVTSKHCPKFQVYDKHFHAVTVCTLDLPQTPQYEVKSRAIQLCVAKQNSIVATWTCFTEYNGSRYIRLLQRIWISLEHVLLDNSVSRYGTLMCVVVRLTPVDTEFDLEKANYVEEMADVVKATYQRNTGMILKAMIEQLTTVPSEG